MSTEATGHSGEAQSSKPDQVGEGFGGVGRQIWLAGLGALAISGDETSQLFHLLVEKGKQFEPRVKESFNKVSSQVGAVGDEASRLIKRLMERGKEFEPTVKDGWTKVRQGVGGTVRSVAGKTGSALDERVTAAIQRLGVPTHEDIQNLARRVEAIAGRLGLSETEAKAPTEGAGEAPSN
jgi:polyhydroxyalkanoate synthesis regulator phasin